MKTMKRLAALLLAVMMVLSVTVPVFADGDTRSITLTNALEGETYNLYKILDLSYDSAKNAYSYTLPADSKWKGFFTGTGTAWFKYDSTSRLVVLKEGVTESARYDIANAMMEYAGTTANGVIATKTKTAEAAGKLVFDNLEMGYYLLDTTAGAVCILDSSVSNLEVTEKSPTPSLTKTVYEESGNTGNGAWGNSSTAYISQDVRYHITVANFAKLNNLVIHDKMGTGLTLNADSIKITKTSTVLTTEALPDELVAGTHYKVVTSPSCTEGCTFHIVFAADFLKSVGKGDGYVIEYTAKLNENAVVTQADTTEVQDTETGNQNRAWLTYGTAQKSAERTVTTRTWQVDLLKYWANPNTTAAQDPLAGASFELHMIRGSTEFVATGVNGDGDITGWAEKDAVGTTAHRFVSGDDGKIIVKGLDSATYHWVEVAPPAGFNLMTGQSQFVIQQTGKLHDSDGTEADQLAIENKTGTELPSTGGVGTTMFYIVGGTLTLGAVVLLITKRRMNAAN